MSTKSRGRPRKTYPGKGVYKKSFPWKIIEFATRMINSKIYPQLGHFAEEIGVTRQTIRNWRKQYQEFDEACKEVEDMQREIIISGGLSGRYDASFSKWLLENNLGVKREDGGPKENTYEFEFEVMPPKESEEEEGKDQ